MTNALDFIDPANRLAVLEQVTAEGMLSLKKETVRGNEYHVFAEAPNNLREYQMLNTDERQCRRKSKTICLRLRAVVLKDFKTKAK